MGVFNSLTRDQKEAVGLLQIGTFLEYFDLMLYVHMAVLLNDIFFPKTDPHTSSVLAAFTFCSTFVLRPFGALIFGYIGDYVGRKATVILTTMLMAFSCLMMTGLPTYAQIGITASWLMITCRILQGLSSMGEIIGAEIYITELIKPPLQYPAVGMIGLSAALGSFAALGVASLVTLGEMNWRIAFLIGGAIAALGSSARSRLRETPDFVDMQRKYKNSMQELDSEGLGYAARMLAKLNKNISKKANYRTLLACFFIQAGWPVCFYFTYVFCGGLLKNNLGYSADQVIHHNLFISVFQALSFLFYIVLSYKIYPLKLLRAKIFIFIPFVFAIPYIFDNSNSLQNILFVQLMLMAFPLNGGPAMSIVITHFPIFRRFSYSSFIYALSRALVYVITSFGFIYLHDYFGNWAFFFILMPTLLGFWWAVKHFERLENGEDIAEYLKKAESKSLSV